METEENIDTIGFSLEEVQGVVQFIMNYAGKFYAGKLALLKWKLQTTIFGGRHHDQI